MIFFEVWFVSYGGICSQAFCPEGDEAMVAACGGCGSGGSRFSDSWMFYKIFQECEDVSDLSLMIEKSKHSPIQKYVDKQLDRFQKGPSSDGKCPNCNLLLYC